MNLPNYFLADLPPEATLNAAMIHEACATLKHNREQYLAPRSTAQLVAVLGEVGANWRRADYPFRQMALALGPAATGFSAATLARGLDAFFGQWTPENFHALLAQDLGHAQRLDELSATGAEKMAQRAAFARGPELLVHITAGNLPCSAWSSLGLGLLLRSAQFVKCASGTALLPRLFAHSLHDTEPKLGACLEVAEWRGGSAAIEDALFAAADCVTATGADETLTILRPRVPPTARFLGYGHRLSFAYVSRGVLTTTKAPRIVTRAADDVVAWDQLGCLSPHVVYVENGGAVSPGQFAEQLAQELAARASSEPRGPVATEIAAAIATRRSFYEVRAAHSADTRLWRSADSTDWTVVFETDPRFQLSCLHRFIYVKSTADLTEVLHSADPVRGKVSTVGLAAADDKAPALAQALARWGVTRICPLGQMQNPPLTWRHDGRPGLGDLVTWTDWEQT